MGVSIYPLSAAVITDRDASEALMALYDEKFEFFNVLAESLLTKRNISNDTDPSKLSLVEKNILAAFNEKDEGEMWKYSDEYFITQTEFPHWLEDLRWDDTGKLINLLEQPIVFMRVPPEKPLGVDYDFSLAYSGYNRFRELISRALLGASPSEVWANPERYSGNDVSLLVNGSDCDGIIMNSVVQKIAKSLNDPESFNKVNELCKKLYKDEPYAFEAMPERYENFARMFKDAGNSGLNIRFS